MMRLLYIFCLLLICCNPVKNVIHEDDIYEKIKTDIKNSESFLKFKVDRGVKSSNFLVGPFEYPICVEFYNIENDDELKSACKKANSLDYKLSNSDREDMNRYSDKEKKGFYLFFSEKAFNKIAVEVIAKKDYLKSGYTKLLYLYEVDNGFVKKLNETEFIVD